MKSSLKLIAAAALVLSLGQGCPAPTHNTTNSGATSQPAADNPPSPCEARAYYNAELRFGFDPPAGSTGPLASADAATTAGRLLDQYFVLPTGDHRPLYFDVTDLDLDLDTWITRWVKESSAEADLIGAEKITTASGRPGYILAWINSSQGDSFGEMQVFCERDGVIFGIYAWAFPDDPQELSTTLRNTFLSLCVD